MCLLMAPATKPNLNTEFCTLFEFCALLKGGGGGPKSFLGTDPTTANKLAKYPCLIFTSFFGGKEGGGVGGAKSFLGTDPVTTTKLAKYPGLIVKHTFLGGGGKHSMLRKSLILYSFDIF